MSKEESFFEKLFIGLVIAGVGWYVTTSTTSTEIESVKTLADTANKRESLENFKDRDIKITKEFITILSNDKKCKRYKEVALLIVLASDKQTAKLNERYLSECNSEEIRKYLEYALNNSKENEVLKIILELNGSNRRNARDSLAELFANEPKYVSTILSRELNLQKNNYKVVLGIVLALNKSEYNTKYDDDLKNALISIKKTKMYKDDSVLKSSLDKLKL